MKIKIILILFTLAMLSCKNEQTKSNSPKAFSAETLDNMLSGDIKVQEDKSTIYWKGYKIFGNHTGTVDLEKGNLVFDDGDITGGDFTINMKSVAVTELMDDGDDDEEEEDESPEDDKSDLAQHLMDADFFDAAQFPKATLKITKAERKDNNYKIWGDMSIKGNTQPITFDAQLVDLHTLKSTITIDRTKFGIKYGSGSFFSNLGDNVIKDNFDLVVSLKLNN